MGLSKEDYRRVSEAVVLTRKIRTGALLPAGRRLTPHIVETQEQNALIDAIRLAEANAQLLVPSDSLAEHRVIFDALTADLNQTYGTNREYAHQRQEIEVVVNRLSNLAYGLSHDWKSILSYEYSKNGFSPYAADLESRKFGIISPLSADFLNAKTLEMGVREKGLTHPPVYPIATHVTSKQSVLPKDLQGRPALENASVIGLYFDVIVSRDTLNAVFRAVRAAYPEKTILRAPLR